MSDNEQTALRAMLGFPSAREDERIFTDIFRRERRGESAVHSPLWDVKFAYYERQRVLGEVEAAGVPIFDLARRIAAVGRTTALWEFGIEDVMSPAPPAGQPLPEPKRGWRQVLPRHHNNDNELRR